MSAGMWRKVPDFIRWCLKLTTCCQQIICCKLPWWGDDVGWLSEVACVSPGEQQ